MININDKNINDYYTFNCCSSHTSAFHASLFKSSENTSYDSFVRRPSLRMLTLKPASSRAFSISVSHARIVCRILTIISFIQIAGSSNDVHCSSSTWEASRELSRPLPVNLACRKKKQKIIATARQKTHNYVCKMFLISDYQLSLA